ncbi:MAG TPA: 23S rRNA (uracil(1939)-C(5))-methyltransferase RlmD [Terriglobales bacterium]|nr:23S rRNA (uracil(1939)-C(5))-methyltransferase RlmD [Terriglobales bacterium]
MELTIEKLIYGGDGLARGVSGERAKAVFVPYVLPGERVQATIVEDKPGFSHAALDQVLEPSKLRSSPPCPYFGRCGGCHYQHIGYEDQLRFKAEILKETLRRVAKLELAVEIQSHASPPLNYRNRTRFHVRTSPDFAIGYFRHRSHELLPIRECPISSPLINQVLTELWKLAEKQGIPPEIEEIELFANHSDDSCLIELYVDESAEEISLRSFAEVFSRTVPEAVGLVCFRNSRNFDSKADLLWGEPRMNYAAAGETYLVSAGAFFQTNRHLLEQMVELAVNQRKGKLALDLYSGVGLFTLALARRFERVIAVESSTISAQDLRANAHANVKVSIQSTEKYLTSTSGKLRPDLVIVDPPRSGLGSVVCQELLKLSTKELVYVSCDPATLARDLKQLTAGGFKIAEMHLIDLFPQTFHIETCIVLTG